jgi:RND family efflux transporter MFP subunit
MRKRSSVALLLAFAAACRGRGGVTAPRAAAAAPRAVRTAQVSMAPASGAVVPATVVAQSRATLSARSISTVTALPFREGDRFAAGAVLVRLDDRAAVAAHAAALAEAAVAETDRARAESLLAKDAATPREAEQARARAESMRAALLAARETLAYSELRAPFAGTVAARPAHVGDIVGPGLPLLEIEGSEGLELQATLDGAEAAALRPGTSLQAVVDGVSSPLSATVRSVSAAGDPATHRFELRATLPSAEGLRSGLFARLALPGAGAARSAQKILVPSAALFSRGGLTGVYVLEDGQARLRWVATGASVAEITEVRAGLVPGERVVVDAIGLEDGAPVVESR